MNIHVLTCVAMFGVSMEQAYKWRETGDIRYGLTKNRNYMLLYGGTV